MFTSRTLRSTAAVAVLVLSLAACGASQDESPTASSDGGGVEATEPAPASEGSESEDESASTEQESDAQQSDAQESDAQETEGDEATVGQEAGTLTITMGGEETTFTPEIVRCNGEPGTIRNVVITMKEDELPLVKVTPGEFALVKLDHQGEPEKTSSPEGIIAEDGTVSFDSAKIGDAVVDGTVTCLQGSQG